MPGGRLTHEERDLIARWLADGLGYAEIGRRLGRPTSTISREVARNGVSRDYLAEQAQQAAAVRARRRKPARTGSAAGEQPGERPGERPGEVARGFVDRFATLLAATGMPRMTSRVFVCLLTADAGGLTSAGLVQRLQVSPASVSKSIAYLEAMRLVMRRTDSGGRRDRYVIDDDVWLRAWQADTGAHGEVAAAARQGVEIFGAGTTAGARLGRMGQFFAGLSEQMSGSTLAEPVLHDALTVIAALAHAGGCLGSEPPLTAATMKPGRPPGARPGAPLTAGDLAAALGWPLDRAVAALAAIRDQPAIADPFALQDNGSGAYTLTARPDRLGPAQCEALDMLGLPNLPFG